MDVKERIAMDLEEARRRTETLLAPVDDARLMAQQDRLMSPLVWDYAHAGVFEELWLVQQLSGSAPIDERLMHLYDAFENPRAKRAELALLDRHQAMAYRDQVRNRVLSILEEVDLESDDPLLQRAFVYQMIVEHEHQHDETILATLQLLQGGYRPALPATPPGREVARDAVRVPAGDYPAGTDDHAPYDNEHPRHPVRLAEFEIDRFPVTNGDYAAFIADGGYRRRELWSDAGWEFVQAEGLEAPKFWRRDAGPETDHRGPATGDAAVAGDRRAGTAAAWRVDRFGHDVEVRPDLPVMHVCWHEAEAYARWAGKRLPTEFEWEVAASFDPATGAQRRYPWGDDPPDATRCNLDQWLYGCAPVGAYPGGASAFGCEQMVGDVWEWTSSDFLPYPGYRTFPYAEYSEVFFGGDYKVLRGASWAARPSVARVTMRNWDHPIRRQIFAGFRLASGGEVA
ncbi:MAG TPA: ergothioneine biosynthesis protein EgtB [Candidatus Dormibacteraeota bacterium]|nr:ergothioneine biosynthesis protein EgtB [Candidatus Dormibacteraeota bacterium]